MPLPSFIRPALIALALSAGLASAQGSNPAPQPVDPRWVWDLTVMYPDDAAWDAARNAFAADLPRLAALKGTLGRDASSLRAALDQISQATQRISRLWVYAGLQASTDSRDARYQERSALMRSLGGRYGSSLAWVEPELQSLGAQKVEDFLRTEPGLRPHAMRLREAQRLARHMLSPETEAALAALSPVIGAPGQARTLLVDADIVWPTLQIDGKPVQITETAYQQLREHPDRAVRKQVFDAFWKQYGQFENTLGTLLAARVEAGTVDARLRAYPSAVAASLAADDVPEAVLRTLVAQTQAALPTLHRYFRLRQKLLKLPDLHYYDIYPPMTSSDRRYTVEQSAALTLQALLPLGPEVQSLLKAALSTRSMHVYPSTGKASGAYQSGVYGLTPFVFLNHQDNHESLTTFAHEWGHGVHTMLADRAQPPETASYSLFVAEIAAITAEVLLAEHLRDQARTKEDRLFVLAQELEGMRGTYFRQTMFAEFELAAHDAMQRGEALSGAS
jgi:oligoendopeptidase F